jgi:antitoxin (DNA-binding transcriptional repressor) of toxin-antitoxin stability system
MLANRLSPDSINRSRDSTTAASPPYYSKPARDPAAMVPEVRATLLAIGQNIRVYAVQPLSTYIDQSFTGVRWMAMVLSGFGLLAFSRPLACTVSSHIASVFERRRSAFGWRWAPGGARFFATWRPSGSARWIGLRNPKPALDVKEGQATGRESRCLRWRAMCHNVHMKTISIRELHLKTGRWVRHAASRGPIVVTDRGRRVAALQPFDASVTGRPLPNREAAIRKRSKVPVDSAVYQAELREDR